MRQTARGKADSGGTRWKCQSDYLHLDNESYLCRTLRLLGVNEAEYQKETKGSLLELFPKNAPNPSNSKQFFFIVTRCMRHLLSPEDFQSLKMWYPPKTVNQQIQFKKTFFKMAQKLETHNTLPKHFMISKTAIMGDSPVYTVIELLRTLSEFALRAIFLERFSKEDRLIQIAINPIETEQQNDINRFYLYPFVESKTGVEPPLQREKIEMLKDIFRLHIQSERKKILRLRTLVEDKQEMINPQELMQKLVEEKQLAGRLGSRIPKSVMSENRAFDRRVILDKHQAVWRQLSTIQCNFLQSQGSTVLKMPGQVDKILSLWEPAQGLSRTTEFIAKCNALEALKKQVQTKKEELAAIRKETLTRIASLVHQ